MKSSEVLARCPACGEMKGKEFMARHIAQAAHQEKKSNLQAEKKHINYLITGLRQEAIIKSKNYEEKNRS
jgi:sarcosine oxidase delta subunit